jgi:hypothetical protein
VGFAGREPVGRGNSGGADSIGDSDVGAGVWPGVVADDGPGGAVGSGVGVPAGVGAVGGPVVAEVPPVVGLGSGAVVVRLGDALDGRLVVGTGVLDVVGVGVLDVVGVGSAVGVGDGWAATTNVSPLDPRGCSTRTSVWPGPWATTSTR